MDGLPERMVTSSLASWSDTRLLSKEWYSAARLPGGMYALAWHRLGGGDRAAIRHLKLNAVYNQALLLLDRFELGADPDVIYHHGLVQAVGLGDNARYGGLQGRTGNGGGRTQTLEADAALKDGTHYSLFSPQLEPLKAPERLRLRRIGLGDRLRTHLSTLFLNRADPVNVLRTRKLRKQYRDAAGRIVYHQIYYVARQHALSGQWTISLYDRAFGRMEPVSTAGAGPGYDDKTMWEAMMRHENALTAQHLALPDQTALETTADAFRRDPGERALYFGRFLPSHAHAILQMRDLPDDLRRRSATIDGAPGQRLR